MCKHIPFFQDIPDVMTEIFQLPCPQRFTVFIDEVIRAAEHADGGSRF